MTFFQWNGRLCSLMSLQTLFKCKFLLFTSQCENIVSKAYRYMTFYYIFSSVESVTGPKGRFKKYRKCKKKKVQIKKCLTKPRQTNNKAKNPQINRNYVCTNMEKRTNKRQQSMFCISSSHENLESLTYTDNIKQTKNKVKKKAVLRTFREIYLKPKEATACSWDGKMNTVGSKSYWTRTLFVIASLHTQNKYKHSWTLII